MAADYQIVAALPEHVEQVAPRMRATDRAEVWAADHSTPQAALEKALRSSVEAWAWLVDGRAEAIWGVMPMSVLGGKGVPWLLGTDEVERHAIHFARASRRLVRRMRATWPLLANFVDCRQVTTIRWLRWLGAEVLEPAPFGAEGLPFQLFYWEVA